MGVYPRMRCVALSWPSDSLTYTSDCRILSKLTLLTKRSEGLRVLGSAMSLKPMKIHFSNDKKTTEMEELCKVKSQNLIINPPPGVPSLTGQGKPSCHCPEKIKKSSFNPLFDTGRHWINLTSEYLDFR